MILQWAEEALNKIEYAYVFNESTPEETIQQLNGFITVISKYAAAYPEHEEGASREIRGATFLRDMYEGLQKLKEQDKN
jgi:hypothetical protein